MGDMSRREVAAGLAGLVATGTAPAQEPKPPAKPVADPELQHARGIPLGYMFVEQATSKTDAADFDLVITSARGPDGAAELVRVRTASMAVFRAVVGKDEFTQQGGWYWRCGKI